MSWWIVNAGPVAIVAAAALILRHGARLVASTERLVAEVLRDCGRAP